MKPNADMITKILHNLRVNGRFNQDQLIIGRGQDEQLQLMISDTVGIRYTPKVTGERTFTILGTTDHPVFDETVTLYPYSKPVNDFTNSWVLADEDVIWISDKFTDPDFPNTRYIMYIGGAGGPNPNQWRVHTIGSSDTGIYGVDWNNASNTPDFLGAQENVTWSNGEASAYPSSPSDWSTSGYQGVQPTSFSMTNTEGSDPKLEYTNNGTTWYEFGRQGSVSLTYEPIEFNASHLSNDGKITIQHNFNDKNVLCLGCTPQPKEIEYLDNQIVLDYSDQNSSNFTGAVWFVNSAQSMLVIPGGGVIDPEEPSGQVKVSGAGISDADGIYTLTSGSASEPLEYTKEGTGWIITRTMGYDPTHTHVNWSIRNTNTNAYAYASESFGGIEVKYPWELTWVMDPDGAEPVPTVEQYTPTSVVLPNPSIRISNCGVEEANGDYSIIPEQYWDQYVDPTYLQNHTVVQLWTNGTGVLETNGAEPYIYPVGSDPSKVDPWYAGVVSTDPNDPLTVSVWITLDNGIAPVPTLESI